MQTLGLFAFRLCAYVLAAHAEQGPPNCPTKPALHTQAVCAMEPLGDCELAGQAVQLADPVTLLYVFASQIVQLPPSGPVNP